jgi:hypothetical protein
MNDILCKCGHAKKDHERFSNEYCFGCWSKRWSEKYAHKFHDELDFKFCRQYVPDNLTHIEYLAKEKGLI